MSQSEQELIWQNKILPEQVQFSRPVLVTFNPTAPVPFTFVPETVRMRGRGRVVLQRDPPGADWTFIVGIVKDDKAEQFSSAVRAQGGILHIHDEYRALGSFQYRVMVELDGQYHLSPDPVIVNDPPP
jgi:hypothetical protein